MFFFLLIKSNFLAIFLLFCFYLAMNIFDSILRKPSITKTVLKDTQLNKASVTPSFHTLARDEFVRSNEITSQSLSSLQAKRLESKKHIEQLYDEVFNELIGQNPRLAGLNIQKPKIVFLLKSDFTNAFASYNFMYNEIKASDRLTDDKFYLVHIINKSNGTLAESRIATTSDIEKYRQSKNPLYENKIIELNDEEKELYIKSVFAHELRHCIQHHCLGACKTTTDKQNEIYDLYFSVDPKTIKALAQKIDLLKKFISMGQKTDNKGNDIQESLEYSQYLLEKFSSVPYYKTYEPRKSACDDLFLNLSIIAKGEEKCHISTKEHLLPALQNRINKEGDKSGQKYLNDAAEIDAYDFQADYLKRKINSSSEIRKDICWNIVQMTLIYALLGYNYFLEAGNKLF